MSIQFTSEESEILYSFPQPPSTLSTIIRWYKFLNRIANPSYELVKSCFNKGVSAGIIIKDGTQFKIESSWYDQIHAADKSTVNEMDSMNDFIDWFTVRDFPMVCDVLEVVTNHEYDEAITLTLPQ